MPLSGDLVFTSTPTSPVSLQGTEKSSGGMIIPVGFGSGEKQFGGDALVVSGFSGGTANACFSFPTYRYGWRGGVYEWTGEKWTALPTTIGNPEGKEGAPSTACANIYNSGTYALLISFSTKDAPESNLEECANIDEIMLFVMGSGDAPNQHRFVVATLPSLPLGTLVDYEFRRIIPAGAITGAITGSGIIYNFLGSVPALDVPETGYLEFGDNLQSFTFRIYVNDCYKEVTFGGR